MKGWFSPMSPKCWGGRTPLGKEQAIDEGIDLADVRISARRDDAVAARRARRAAGEVVVFVRRHEEQRVVLGDGIRRQPVEEFLERGVVRRELGDVSGLAGPEGTR